MGLEIYKVLSEKLTDYIWKSPRNEYQFDTSARTCVQNQLLVPIVHKLNQNIIPEEDAFNYLVGELKNDPGFCDSIFSRSNKIITEYNEHYKKYGGKAALFAFCLAYSVQKSDPEKIYKAKASLLNWYFENRKISWDFLNGNHAAAWFPFDWLIENFNSIVNSILVAGTFNVLETKGWGNTVEFFFQPLCRLKDQFNPYPESLIKNIGGNIDLNYFAKNIEGVVKDHFFYIFGLDKADIEKIAHDWSHFFFNVITSLSTKERSFLDSMMNEPKEVNLPKDFEFINNFRGKELVHLLERNTNNFALSIYPKGFVEE